MVDTVRSAQARRQTEGTRERPVQGRTQKAGFPNATPWEKYERQTSIVTPPASYYDGTMSEENRELGRRMDALKTTLPYAGFSGGFDEQDDASIDGWRIHRRNTPTGNTVYEFEDAKSGSDESSTPNRVAYLIKQSDIDAGHSPYCWMNGSSQLLHRSDKRQKVRAAADSSKT